MRNRGLGVAMAAALALAGCGGGKAAEGTSGETAQADTTAAAPAADFDPCSVLTAEEVTAITTDKVTGTKREDDTCHYLSNPDGLNIMVRPKDGKQQMAIVHKAAEVLGGMGAAVADKGPAGADAAAMLQSGPQGQAKVGDDSFWQGDLMFSARRGDAFVQVTAPLMHDPATHSGYPIIPVPEKRAIAEKLAALALNKMSR